MNKNGETTESQSYFVTNENDEKPVVHNVPYNETRCAVLANLYSSEGKPGPVR